MAGMLSNSHTLNYDLCPCIYYRPRGAGKNKIHKRILKKTIRRKEKKVWRADYDG